VSSAPPHRGESRATRPGPWSALFAEAERAGDLGVACSPRRGGNGVLYQRGHGSAAEWLGALEGSSTGAARGRLAAAERAAVTPVLTRPSTGATCSAAQLQVVTKTTAEVADAAGDPLADGTGRGQPSRAG